jgi:hypothetical protein
MIAGREVFLEFQRLGNAVKVTATDSETLLQRAAIDKLNYVLRKRAAGERTRGKP